MIPLRLLAAAAMSAFVATPALAQDPSATPKDSANTPPVAGQPAPAADQSGTPVSAMTINPATGVMVVRQDSVSPEQAATLRAGDANVVSNGPIPETAENRARYGAPISNGGRRTVPAGN